MSYKIRVENFEGPFDLLLYLVSRQKVDIGSISIAEIADQYLEEIAHMENLDLDVASDFLLVASTLLEIKAQSLIAHDRSDLDEEIADITPSQAHTLLISRLMEYKKYKDAASHLYDQFIEEGHMHTRVFGPGNDFKDIMPDFLSQVTLDELGDLAASALAKREIFLLESNHIAARPIPVEVHVRAIHQRIKECKHLQFSDLVNESSQPEFIVVAFLAVLELYKRQMVDIKQPEAFGDIAIDYIEGSGELNLKDENALTSVSITP